MSAEMQYIYILKIMVPCEVLLIACGMCYFSAPALLSKLARIRLHASHGAPQAKLPHQK